MTDRHVQTAESTSSANELEATRPKRGPRGIVVVFGMWCKGCGLCVEFCPTGVLALDEFDHPFPAHAEKCNACRWCETHCPDLAIIVKPVQ